jgi:hypothetical protein
MSILLRVCVVSLTLGVLSMATGYLIGVSGFLDFQYEARFYAFGIFLLFISWISGICYCQIADNVAIPGILIFSGIILLILGIVFSSFFWSFIGMMAILTGFICIPDIEETQAPQYHFPNHHTQPYYFQRNLQKYKSSSPKTSKIIKELIQAQED